jgi:hypothetical protein
MYEKIFGAQHRITVLRLYKTILRLHQSLPNELRDLGNQYVRDEFRRHKNAQPEFVTNFMIEWSVSTVKRKKSVKYDLSFPSFLSRQSSSSYDTLFIFFLLFSINIYTKTNNLLFFFSVRRSTLEY